MNNQLKKAARSDQLIASRPWQVCVIFVFSCSLAASGPWQNWASWSHYLLWVTYLAITSKLVRFLTQHIDNNCSLEFTLPLYLYFLLKFSLR